MLVFLLFWIIGGAVGFLYLRSQTNTITPDSAKIDLIISGLIGIVFSYAGKQANLNHWFFFLVFAAAAGIATYRLIKRDKK